MSPADCVRLELEDRVATLLLARPEVLNAIDDRVCDALSSGLDQAERSGATVLVLAGEGRAFSAGADLGFMRGLAGEGLRRFIERTWLVGERIARSPLLSIAAIHGYALGGGAELALACDLRVAESTAMLGFPEMTLGSVPGSGAMQRLPALVGPSRALELVVDGRRLDGEEAGRIGLVNRVVPAGDLRAAVRDWARGLAARPGEAIRYAKACLRLPAEGGVAPLVHGLVSSACQSATGYREKTQRFAAGHGAA